MRSVAVAGAISEHENGCPLTETVVTLRHRQPWALSISFRKRAAIELMFVFGR
jgi:hypothetical protein